MIALVLTAGVAQLVLAAGSLAIPRVLEWRTDVARLRPLTRQVFWTYAGYIWTTNVAFGLLSVAGPHWLLDGTPLAAAVTGFIALYWSARMVIQFAWFDRRDMPPGRLSRGAEVVLVLLFLFLAFIYARALIVNLTGAMA